MDSNSAQICNISGQEIENRRRVGLLGLFFSIVAAFLILKYSLNPILIAPFVFMSAIGFIQAYYKYCVAIGLLNIIKEPGKFKEEIFYILKITFISTIFASGHVIILWIIIKYLL